MAIVPASIRNKNPGAMYPGKSARKFGSSSYETLRSKDGTHKIATFKSHTHGVAALFDLLGSPAYTDRTIREAITKWCGGYYAGTYLRVLEEKSGIKPDDMLTQEMVHNADIAIPIGRAMALQEAGREYPVDDAGWREGHAMAFGGSVAPAWTPGNDVPTRRPEDRRDDAVKTGAVVTTAAGGVVATVEAAKLVPPDISLLTAWQGAADAAVTLAKWSMTNMHIAGGAVIVAGLVWAWRSR